MNRVVNWPNKLADFIGSRVAVPFQWGEHDCCLFAADAILSITGEDLAAEYRGYKSEAQATEILDAHGGLEGLVEDIAEEYGLPEVKPSYAKRGDLVLLEVEGERALGVIGADSSPTCPGKPIGLGRFRRERIVRAWSVG